MTQDIYSLFADLSFGQTDPPETTPELNSLLLSLAEMTQEGLFLLRADNLQVVFLNKKLFPMLGYADLPPDEPLSDFLHRNFYPYDIPRLNAALQSSAAENKEVAGQYRLRHVEGHWQQIALRHKVLLRDSTGKALVFLCFVEDMAQKGQSEQAALDRLYILENAHCLLWSADVHEIGDPEILRWETQYPTEDAAQRFLPLPVHDQGYAIAFYMARFEEDKNRCNALAAKSIRAGQSYEQEFRVRTLEGEVRWMHESLRVETIEAGKQWRVIGVCTDVTESKLTGQALQESEERFRLLVDELPLLVWMLDAEGNHLFVNRTWREFTGRTIEDTQKYGWQLLIHPDELPGFQGAFQRFLQRRAPHQTEFRFAHHSGQYRPILNTAVPRFYPDGTFLGFIGASIDITEQKTLQAQLIESQKLESMGKLAGGIAHDFNNLLTAILGYTEMAQTSLPENAGVLPYLANVQLAAERAADLTRQLLMYARRQMVEFTSVDINAVIVGMAPLLRRTIGEHYELLTVLTNEACYVNANTSQMEQVLTNLVVNARDAMPTGGRILIETQCVFLDEHYTDQHFGMVPGEYVLYSVSDNGMGMTAEVRERIFEPFYTTKEIGRGTGLGLATCYGIVKQSKGSIWVYSEPENGTIFKVYLPRIHEVAAKPTVAPDNLPEGTETILLVDDEPMVREIAAHSLRARGYRVLEASDGMEALQVQREWKGKIDLLVSDVVMPQMGGKELAGRLLGIYPAMRVLYMSGYTENVVLQQGVLKPGVALLTKPFTSAGLLQKVKEALTLPTDASEK